MNKDKINKLRTNRWLRYGGLLLAGVLLGAWIFGGSSKISHDTEDVHVHAEEETVWTCSMHPQIRSDKPGKCPLCAMDLTPLLTGGTGDELMDPDALPLSVEAMELARIQTQFIRRENPVKEIRLYGTIQPDERLSQSQTSHVNGRIEKLFVNFTGETVQQGQTIATVYSPDLLSAQQELLEAIRLQGSQSPLAEAARQKLKLWKLTDVQIAGIESSGNVSPVVDIQANTGGIVSGKRVNEGDYINQGGVLFDLSNLSKVWGMFEAYESDLPFLKVGNSLSFTLSAWPGRSFSGKISFIDPVLDRTTRTAKVRVEIPNPKMELKPEMYAQAVIQSPLQSYNNEIVVPKSAVLWTGKRSIVYRKQPGTEMPSFLLCEVELGPSLGASYVILSGLSEGDEIVTHGAFMLDASAQLAGKRSMMNPEEPMPAHPDGEAATPPASDGSTPHTVLAKENEAKGATKLQSETLRVEGLCEMCKKRIEEAARSVSGVTTALWNTQTKMLQLTFDPARTSLDAISRAVAKVGHDNALHKTDQKTYDALHGCCQYR